MSDRQEATIWTDGACAGNPGPGGYAAVLLCGEKRVEVSGGRRLTTNNRMELLALIEGLRALAALCRVTAYSDSRYVVDALNNGSARRWRMNRWLRHDEPVPNADLWGELLALCDRHDVTLLWVRGHGGTALNELCDRLAVLASQRADLPADEGYENRTELAAALAPRTLFDIGG
jgi:ribonuclease HI